MSNRRNKFNQGIFTPINPKKYIGKKKYSYYRSSWELTFMKYLDKSENILGWCSECVVIPYNFNGKNHRYYPDFLVVKENNNRLVIEIKPLKQTKPPRKSKNKSRKTIMYEAVSYYKNMAKWEYAKTFCKKRNWEFLIMTENTLTIK